MHHLLGVLPLSNGQYVAITARNLEIEPQDKEKLRYLRNLYKGVSEHPNPQIRGWSLMLNDQEVHALLEVAPWPD
jgi:hypothetical protein